MSSAVRAGAKAAPRPAATLPVARVAVDISLPHLDRPFEYLIPEPLGDLAEPGCRVRVRFAGRLTGGYLLGRAADSEHQGKLGYLQRVVSAEPVLTPEIAGLARAVADRYGGTLADVLRLAIPPRHAAVEAEPVSTPLANGQGADRQGADRQGAEGRAAEGRAGDEHAGPGPWASYADGPSFLAALADGRSPRAIWSALAGPRWPAEIAGATAAVRASGRGAVVVVPDARDLNRVEAALAARFPRPDYVTLAAGLGPAERYRRWLRVARGEVKIVAGPRSAMFAPVADLGLVVIWDDGDDLHAEPRAPYPHAREVLALRAHLAGAAALIGGFARTAEAEQLLARSWARPLAAERLTVRAHAPQVIAAGDDAELAHDEAARSARLPSLALRTVRAALQHGPVLFQVPRAGYLAAVGCDACRAQARCGNCGGPAWLAAPQAPLTCRWCGAEVSKLCASCGYQGLRAVATGAQRTAEELGRAFPAVPVRSSGGSRVLAQVPGSPAVVVATPGAEPVADGGYAAGILLDGAALLGRASLRAAEEALRRWMNAAALVRPGPDGGSVVVVAEAGLRAVQALVRWDPATFARRELAERAELRFPPVARMASLTGAASAVKSLLEVTELPAGAELFGPVPATGPDGATAAQPGQEPVLQYLVRAPRSAGSALALALRAGQAVRSARKEPGTVRVQLDPAEPV